MPTISRAELRNGLDEILRRAEGGEEFLITVSNHPTARLGPVRTRQWVTGAELTELWDSPTDATLENDLEMLTR
jgi:prevent-host-death family protein